MINKKDYWKFHYNFASKQRFLLASMCCIFAHYITKNSIYIFLSGFAFAFALGNFIRIIEIALKRYLK